MSGRQPSPPSLEVRAHELNTLVKGWIIPIFQGEPDETGRRLNGLGPVDFQKVVSGYACGDCLAEFFTYMVRCPVCGHTRDLAADIRQSPSLWQDHLKDRASGRVTGPPLTMDDVIGDIMKDPNIEHIPMDKLHPKRRPKEKKSD